MAKKPQKDDDQLADARLALAEQLSKLLGDKPAAAKSEASAQPKVIRDSFTLPENDYNLIAHLQERSLGLRMHVTKSEMLRAGLHALENLSDDGLIDVLQSVEKLKPGRRKET